MALTKVSTGLISADLASVDLNIDANTLYIDVTNNRVGINNTGPATALDVTGTVTADGLSIAGTGITGMNIEAGASSVAYIDFGDSADTNIGGINYNNADDTLNLRAGNTNRVTVDSSGNVGIGTSPSTTLHLLAASTNIRLEDSDTNAYAQVGADNAGSLYLQADNGNGQASSNMYMYVDGTERMRIDSSGNVGIGVSSSVGAPLHMRTSGATNLWLDSSATSDQTNRLVSLHSSGGAYSTLAIDAGTHLFRTGTTPSMAIDSSGNVGIGTDSPAYITEIAESQAGGVGPTLYLHNTVDNVATGHAADIRFNLRNDEATSRNAIIRAQAAAGYGSDPNLLFLVSAGSTGTPQEAMRIDSNGNLLIGTDDTAAFDGTTGILIGGANNALAFSATGNNQMLIYSTTDGLQFYDSTNNAQRMLLDNSGNLLVGITSGVSAGSEGIELRGDFGFINSARNTTAAAGHHQFFNPNGIVGNIVTAGTGTAYNTSSDARLKDSIVDAPSASDDIDAIQVRSFDWKADGSHQKYGMVAQELVTVAPEAVYQPEDPEEMMGVDYSKLVPMMLKEIQSLRARVAQLEGAN